MTCVIIGSCYCSCDLECTVVNVRRLHLSLCLFVRADYVVRGADEKKYFLFIMYICISISFIYIYI